MPRLVPAKTKGRRKLCDLIGNNQKILLLFWAASLGNIMPFTNTAFTLPRTLFKLLEKALFDKNCLPVYDEELLELVRELSPK
jgi:hypothetical protein